MSEIQKQSADARAPEPDKVFAGELIENAEFKRRVKAIFDGTEKVDAKTLLEWAKYYTDRAHGRPGPTIGADGKRTVLMVEYDDE